MQVHGASCHPGNAGEFAMTQPKLYPSQSFQDLANIYNAEQDMFDARDIAIADVEDLVESIIHTEVCEDDRMEFDYDPSTPVELVQSFRSNLWE
jgi:hypothetical protein